MAAAGIVIQPLQVEKLGRAAGAEPHEPLEFREVSDLQELSHIPLHMGLQVIPQSLGGIQPLVVDPGVEPRMEKAIGVGKRPQGLQLPKG